MKSTYIVFVAVVVFLCVGVPNVNAWSGNVCTSRETYYYRVRVCAYRLWRSCCYWRYYWKCGYRIRRQCCSGWRHNGNQVCTIPICSPRCYNGGTCVTPNKCRCPAGYSGDLCGNPLCSWERPCYPGTCGIGTDDCSCLSRYAGSWCNTLQNGEEPQLTAASADLLDRDRGTKETLYSIKSDATSPNETGLELFWSNLMFFNSLIINFESFHVDREDLPPKPSYILSYKFGIVAAYAGIEHKKKKFKSSAFVTALTRNRNCSISDSVETGLLNCTLDFENFFSSIEHRDMLEVIVRAKNGGYRELNKPGSSKPKENYKGRWTEKKMKFEFDFERPYHCSMNSTCAFTPTLPVSIDGPDIRRNGFTIRWRGWEDELSGVFRYIWRIFKMEPDRDRILREVGAPVYWWQRNGTDAGTGSDNYTPENPGMYSIYLQVSDRANNSQYSRTLVLYDPSSEVEINDTPTSRLFVSSASEETRYQWQSDLNQPIRVNWANHFRNAFHENNALLERVHPYEPKDFIYERGHRKYIVSKKVPTEYDDKYGERTTAAIPNKHGVVKFEVAYVKDSVLGRDCTSPPDDWEEVPEPLSESYEFNRSRLGGDSFCIWVRGTDVLGNTNTDMTVVHFDNTLPSIESSGIEKNQAPEGVMFHSTIPCVVSDVESGVKEIIWRLTDKNSGRFFGQGSQTIQKSECSFSDVNCACAPVNTDNCYLRKSPVYFQHCVINATRSQIPGLVVLVEVEAINNAGLRSAARNFTISDVATLDGINDYVAPMNFRSHEVGTTSVTILWDNPPSCYELSAIRVAYVPDDGEGLVNYTSFKLNKEISLNGLNRGTEYVMWIYNIYSTEASAPAEFRFETKLLSGGEIAGLIIGLLLLIGVCALAVFAFVLWRRGKLRSTIERRLTRARTILRNNVIRRDHQSVRNTFFNNLSHDDDLYVYGNMSFDSKENWILEGTDLEIQDLIAEGRFARVYKGVLSARGQGYKTVAAKMLLPTKRHIENEKLLMKAKINFMAKNGIEHENVIRFIGAIMDDEERGPIMILEYCEMGTLKNWLTSQNKFGRVPDEVVDRFFHFAYGVAKGMEYLVSKDVVHRKLAARNILLDFTFQPKISGFGPVPDELAEDSDNKKGERLPLRWMAPELVKARSTRDSNEKSDVWSYGVVVWEIFSLGQVPFEKVKGSELYSKLKQGQRLKRPDFMTDEYDLLTKRCWNQMPEDRPSFDDVVQEQAVLFDAGGKHSSYYDSNQLNNSYYTQQNYY